VQQERANNTRTFLAVRGQQIIGYYATTTYRLGLDEAAAMFGVGRRAYPIPAVLLARLAVDSSCQGSGVGSKLLFHALMQIAAASRYVGFEVVVVHAIGSDAVTFYAQRGFTQFEDHELHQLVHEPLGRGVAVGDDQRGAGDDGGRGGAMPLTAVSAAALAAPYGVTGSGCRVSS
jgi:predicted N-acetyltransferase YhbS